jgi:hypothetical protein
MKILCIRISVHVFTLFIKGNRKCNVNTYFEEIYAYAKAERIVWLIREQATSVCLFQFKTQAPLFHNRIAKKIIRKALDR